MLLAAAAVLVLVVLLLVVLLGRARARGRGRAWRFDLAAGDDVAEAGGATLEAAAASSAFVERDADPCRLAVMVLLRLRLLPAVVVVGAGAEEAAPGCCDIDDGEARSSGARGLPPTGCTSSGTDLAKVVAVSGARCWLLLFLVLLW